MKQVGNFSLDILMYAYLCAIFSSEHHPIFEKVAMWYQAT